MKAIRIYVSGKVQGVFFRKSTKLYARELGICGFVRNERDGSVYIEAEADSINLEKFVKWCRVGPPTSRVVALKVEPNEIKGFVAFEIK